MMDVAVDFVQLRHPTVPPTNENLVKLINQEFGTSINLADIARWNAKRTEPIEATDVKVHMRAIGFDDASLEEILAEEDDGLNPNSLRPENFYEVPEDNDKRGITLEICPECIGAGKDPNTDEECYVCDGEGQIEMVIDNPLVNYEELED